MNYDPTLLQQAIERDNGDVEVTARWVADHLGAFRLVDVREPHELKGPLGKIEGVENVPLLQLLGAAPLLDPKQPLVLICRSGRRSGLAARRLAEAGVETVASVEGGMIAWNSEVFGRTTILREEQVANTQNLAEAISRTNGLPEVSAPWVAANIGRFRLIDVRHAEELEEFGRVAQSEHIPLEEFMRNAQSMDRDAPLVVMCASGGRSGRVVSALEAAGFRAVASLEGGMFGWKASALPAA
ncbi:MAG: rhodanese-like domain-containing protein [Myxococcales bacterium]|nr:rhodanese-like domain-containing protein [Myxococcales bacterium]